MLPSFSCCHRAPDSFHMLHCSSVEASHDDPQRQGSVLHTHTHTSSAAHVLMRPYGGLIPSHAHVSTCTVQERRYIDST